MKSKLFLFIGCQLFTILLTIGVLLTTKTMFKSMTVRSQDDQQNNSLLIGEQSVRLLDTDFVQLSNDGIPAPKETPPLNDSKRYHNPDHGQLYNDSTPRDSGAENKLNFNDTIKNCSPGHFQLNNDGVCHPMLTCKDIKDNVTIMRHLNNGGVKDVYLAKWKEYMISLVRMRNSTWGQQWFPSGVKNVQKFQPSPFVIQSLGYCPSVPESLVTEYHKFGSLSSINQILRETHMDNVKTRFRICLDYVKIINFLHTHPTGTHVMCDTNGKRKTLSQFLITSDLHIIINDLDALPVVDSTKGILNNGTYMGKTIAIDEDFVAPEQIRSYKSLKSTEGNVSGYDEKTDIWKIPAVVDYLLGNGAETVKTYLSKIHQHCRSVDPKKRPTAAEVLRGYLDVQHKLTL